VLTYEPDRAGNFYSLTPRVMINLDDLAATGVVQPGSRVSYRELWRGECPGAGNLSPTDQAGPGRQPAHAGCPRWQPADRRRAGQGRALPEHGQPGGGLLAGVAVALSANRFATRRFDASACCAAWACRGAKPWCCSACN
jgi:putative ABC transport system permease protein